MSATFLEATAQNLQVRLQERLSCDRLEVIDESADHAGHAGSSGAVSGTHFRVRISSPAFHEKSRIARHRLVFDALKDFIDGGVHAVAIEIL